VASGRSSLRRSWEEGWRGPRSWVVLEGAAATGGTSVFLESSSPTVYARAARAQKYVRSSRLWLAARAPSSSWLGSFPSLATISDRGSVFVSQFWTTIFGLMKTDCIATTAYNPRSDGQSERTNQVVEIALRHFVNKHQDDWANHLGHIQFSMNNSPNASTGKSPAELLMAFQPCTAIDIPTAHLPLTGKAR
jgi:hypothetical protein